MIFLPQTTFSCLIGRFGRRERRFLRQGLRIIWHFLRFPGDLFLHFDIERLDLNRLGVAILLFRYFKTFTLLRPKHTVYMPYIMSLAHSESVRITRKDAQ
jgi:hypothetical protein